MSTGGAVLSECTGAFFLALSIWVATDNSRQIVTGTKLLAPAVIGVTGSGILACIGQQTGTALNPARDLGPRLMAAIIYGGSEVWDFPMSNLHCPGCAYRAALFSIHVKNTTFLRLSACYFLQTFVKLSRRVHWWIPIVGPFTGVIIAAIVYILLISAHFGLPKRLD